MTRKAIDKKYEQLIESIINDDETTAAELFHNIVVQKSQRIYNQLVAEDEMGMAGDEQVEEDALNMDATDDMIDDIDSDEEGVEGDNAFGDEGDTETGDTFGDEGDSADADADMGGEGDEFGSMDDDFGGEEGGSEAATKDDIMGLEDAIAELTAEFKKITGEETGEGEFGEAPPEEGTVREYVEKVSAKSENKDDNVKSPVATGRKDMGGTAKNLVQGGTTDGGKAKVPGDTMGAVDPRKAGKSAFTKKVAAPSNKDGASGTKSLIGGQTKR